MPKYDTVQMSNGFQIMSKCYDTCDKLILKTSIDKFSIQCDVCHDDSVIH